MTEDQNRNKLTSLEKENPGFITGISRNVRLVLRLLADKRVNFFLKLLPIGALAGIDDPGQTNEEISEVIDVSSSEEQEQ